MQSFLLLKKIYFFLNISNRPNRTAKNRIAIDRKINPRRCASVPIMKKPISIGSVINLKKKNHPYRTAHTPSVGWCYMEQGMMALYHITVEDIVGRLLNRVEWRAKSS